MCGFVGIIQFGNQAHRRVEPETVQRMLGTIGHRGPDDAHAFISSDGRVGLGFVRLGIIDLEKGRQPMVSASNGTVIAFNGEIYDFLPMRAELAREGFSFATRSDTEVLLQSYHRHGVEVTGRLNGDFAFCIHDEPNRRSLLARDRFGIKPLYYHLEPGRMIFGSEMKAILAHPEVARRINPTTVVQQMMRADSLARTLFQGIHILPPGHRIVIQDGQFRLECYHDVRLATRFRTEPATPLLESAARLRNLLESSVRRRLVSDFEVGCLLSGGLDSSIIAALMTRERKEPVPTFAIRFGNRDYDESGYARQMAGHLGSRHHDVDIRSVDLVRHLPEANWLAEHLVQSTDGVGKYLLCRYARRHVKVVMTGEGADDIGLGLPLYRMAKALADWDPGRGRLLQEAIAHQETAKKGQDLTESSHPHRQRFLREFGFYPVSAGNILEMEAIGPGLFARDFLASVPDLDARQVYGEISRPHGLVGRSAASQNQYEFIKTTLPYYVFQYLGGQSEMGASLEGRVPFLDNEVAAFAFSLPECYHLFGMTEKFLLRTACADLLPEAIAWRPKHGYSAPIFEGFAGPDTPDYFEHFLSREAIRNTRVFDFPALERLRNRLALPGLAEQERILHEKALFMILSFQLMNDMFIDRFDPSGGMPSYA